MLRLVKITAMWIVLTTLFCAEAAAQQQGQAVFEARGNCFTCHGRDAKGTPLGPDLTDGEWLNIDGSLDSIRSIVRAGVPRPRKYAVPMPAMGGARLSRAEVDAVAAYVFGLNSTAEPSRRRQR